jgi:hypothetical protein
MRKDSIIHPTEVILTKKGFWDADGYYFNRDGYDKHGGYYDDNFNYIGGPGRDEQNECYKDEYNNDGHYFEDDGDCII